MRVHLGYEPPTQGAAFPRRLRLDVTRDRVGYRRRFGPVVHCFKFCIQRHECFVLEIEAADREETVFNSFHQSMRHGSRRIFRFPNANRPYIIELDQWLVFSRSGNGLIRIDEPWDQEGESRDNCNPDYRRPFANVPSRITNPVERYQNVRNVGDEQRDEQRCG